MKLSAEVRMRMILYNRNNMEPLTIDRIIKKSWEEGSEEYKILCERYDDAIKKSIGRECDNKNKYDKELIKMATEEIVTTMSESVSRIVEVVKEAFLKESCAYVEYAGYIVNVKDFCAVCVKEPEIRMCKE